MTEPAEPTTVAILRRTADRLDELADTAELMGDADAAADMRSAAWSRRAEAMSLLDD